MSEGSLRIDSSRLRYILDRVVLDERRNLVEVPEWDSLVEAFSAMPYTVTEDFQTEPVNDPAPAQRGDTSFVSSRPASQAFSFSEHTAVNPCDGCEAHCCKVLVFAFNKPQRVSDLDYIRFALGFPGVEVIVSDEEWGLTIRSTCSHLENNRCSIFGKPERPLRCSYYDAWQCFYKPLFSTPHPDRRVRVAFDDFEAFVDCFRLDETGGIAVFPTVDTIRERLASGWQESGSADSIGPRRLLPLILAPPVSSLRSAE